MSANDPSRTLGWTVLRVQRHQSRRNGFTILTGQCDWLVRSESDRWDMRLTEWQKGAFIASIVWAIAGFFCGVHFPVAPALRTYEHCLRDARSAADDCHSKFIAEWNIHSPNRLYSGLALTLIPIPLIGLVFYAARGRSNPPRDSSDFLSSLMH